RGLYHEPGRFRAAIDRARHGLGEGQYRSFAAPSPEPVDALRHGLYGRLLPIARDWYARLGRRVEWPDTLDEWLEACHAAGQTRPTPILLRYGTGGWNAPHRDLYGDKGVPRPAVGNLSGPGARQPGGRGAP